MAWNRHAIEQVQLRRQRRVDGVGRPKFDFHTGAEKYGADWEAYTQRVPYVFVPGLV